MTNFDQLCAQHREPCSPNTETFERNEHKHKCDACGYTWKHADGLERKVSEEAHILAHTCPGCGAHQFWKHHTPQEEAAIAKIRDCMGGLLALFELINAR